MHDLQKVLDKFETYCQPRKNITFERFKFNSRSQNSGEPFDQYITSLRQLQDKCDFDKITPNELLRDRIVFGIVDQKVRERLLCEADLSLEKVHFYEPRSYPVLRLRK